MSDALLTAVLDTLLPGDDGVAGPAPLPPASRLIPDLAPLQSAAQALLDQLAAAKFLAADQAARADMLRALERSAPEEFRRFLDRVLAAYYQDPAVLAAFGWRDEPPMPRGHALAGEDAATLLLLDRVRARGPIWRP
ncbi:MAG TPA: hypothetical protein PLR41_00340 [Alphaproteobacteria bacterium]|nr:hypothetical protein [Alphaproteobacteria bacterium]